MRKPYSPLQNSRGQFVIEAVLLMTLSFGLFVWGTRYFRTQKVISNAVQGPWEKASMMIETGIWAPKKPETLNRHPNTAQNRGVTLQDFNQ